MKRLTFLFTAILFFAPIYMAAQNTWITREGTITFFSEAPLENIDATSKKAVAVLNTENRNVVSRVAINTFIFQNGLMQDHFNDNFMESDKYPLANLRAEIVEDIDFTVPGVHDVTLIGTLEIREIVQDRELQGKVTITENGITAEAQFWVPLVDHDIKVPRLLLRNIAEEILVTVKLDLEPHKQ